MPESRYRHRSQQRSARSARDPAGGRVDLVSFVAIPADGVEEVTVGAELQLTRGSVSGADGLAVSPAGEVERCLPIRDGFVDAVEDVQIAPVVADGVEEPGDGAVDFFVQTEVDEGVERERRVSTHA